MPTALLSVYDKAGIVDLAAGLHSAGWRIVSSGGTAKVIAEAGVPVTDLVELTGLPAILDHRVVTLHPKVHGGLLADPTNPAHQADMAAHGIEPIDLVVVNLYPFTTNPSIELIDIGGPAMVRAAAKNHAHVGVVVNPADYRVVLDEIGAEGQLSSATRRRLAPRRVRSNCRLRRGHSQLVRRSLPRQRRGSARGSAPFSGTGAVSALRREPSPAGCPLSHGWRPELVGQRSPTPGQGSQLPQPLRLGGGVEACSPLRQPCLCGRQACQPLRCRRRRRHRRSVRRAPTPAIR